MEKFITEALFFLALVNPVSKVLVLSLVSKEATGRDLRKAALMSSGVALGLLVLFAGVGSRVMTDVLHVKIYALQVAGGSVLFFIGLKALNQGRFFELDEQTRLTDLSMVPLGSPMIAGPGTITAAISESAVHGFVFVSLAIAVVLVINLVIMLWSVQIGKLLERFHLMGPLIRITGFVVAGIAVQMVLSGLSAWNWTP